MKNCNECKFINITEEEQEKDKKPHVCLKHNTRLFHRNNNPKINHSFIYPCNQCNGENFEFRN